MAHTQSNDSSRVRAIKTELDKCAQEYAEAKDQFEKSRVEFEIAREKLSGVRQLATNMLTHLEWQVWRLQHPHVMYAGVPIGESIQWALWSATFDTAWEIINNNKDTTFPPSKSLEEICHELEAGGYDFRSTTPLREINGALLQLKGILKSPDGNYFLENADEVYEGAKQSTQMRLTGGA